MTQDLLKTFSSKIKNIVVRRFDVPNIIFKARLKISAQQKSKIIDQQYMCVVYYFNVLQAIWTMFIVLSDINTHKSQCIVV